MQSMINYNNRNSRKCIFFLLPLKIFYYLCFTQNQAKSCSDPKDNLRFFLLFRSSSRVFSIFRKKYLVVEVMLAKKFLKLN
jgi:hypothetical protein